MSLNDDTNELDTNDQGDGMAGDAGGVDENDAGAAEVAASLASGGGGEFIVDGEPKSANKSTLLLFGLVLLAGGGLYLMYVRGGPDSASAAANAEAAKAKQTISQFLDGGEKNMVAMQQMLRETEKVVDQFLQYPSMKQVPLEALATNPFEQKIAKKDPVEDAEAKARAAAEAEARRKEDERQAILKAVDALSLQTIMAGGARKSCMINGTLFTEGQVIDGGFTIDKINPDSVIVKNSGYRFILKMKK